MRTAVRVDGTNAGAQRHKRFCACGCGERLPDDATRRRKYVNATHRKRAYAAKAAK